MASLGEAILRIRADASELIRGLQAAKGESEQTLRTLDQRLEATGRRLSGLGTRLTIGLTTPLAALGTLSVRAASEAEETESKFRTVFRNIGDSAQAAADRLSDSYGQSDQAAQALLANTGDLLTGFGFTQEAALDLSSQVNELAIDLASFTNFQGGAEGASQALTSALLGEREAAKSLGIAITEDVVQAKIDELRANGELLDATDAQARAYATLKVAQEQSANAIGDFARTSDSYANQTRILTSNLNDLQVALGEGILPIATPLVAGLADMAAGFADMGEGARTAVLVIGGGAAAAGPLLLGLGQLLTVLPKVAAGVRLVMTAAAPLLGPAALIAGGVVLVDQLSRQIGDGNVGLIGRARQAADAIFGWSERQRRLNESLSASVRLANELGSFEGGGEGGGGGGGGGRRAAPDDASDEDDPGLGLPPIPTLETYKRTVEDVFADLATAGTIAERRAEALGNTVEDRLASVETRAGLVSNAIDEMFELGLTAADARVQYLVGRLEALQSEAERLQAILEPGGLSGRLAREGDGGLSDVVAARRGAAAPDEERRVLAQGDPTRRLEAIREQLANGPVPITLADDEARRLLSQGDGARGRIDAATAARTDRLLAPALDEERRILAQGGPESARARIDAAVARAGEVAEAQARSAGALTTFERETIAASTALVGLTRAQDAVLGVLGRAQAATIRGDRVAGGYGAAGDLSGRPVNFPTAVDRFEDPLAGPSSLDSRGKFVFSGLDENIGQAGEEFAQQQADSAKEFADTIIGAGQGFVGAISQFQAGNIGGGIASLAGAAGGIANFFAPGIGSLIGGAGGLLGGIINLFSGGGNDLDQVRQQEAQRARSVPAITFEATVNQTNNYQGGPQLPEVEQAQRRHARVVIEEFMAATRLPQRVAALEGA